MISPDEHEYTDKAVCPHCGYVNRESYELGDGRLDDGHTECGSCGLPYTWSRYVTIQYSTEKEER